MERSVSAAAASGETAAPSAQLTTLPPPPPVCTDGATLLAGYGPVVDTILREVEACGAGDRLTMSVYVVEPGRSTDQLLAALRRAAERGVGLTLQCDYSLTSHVTRFFEGTETKAAVLAELAAAFPETVTFTPQTIPTHAKYFIFQRRDAADSAVFGGVNIGDRFASWRDFAVLLQGGALVGQLAVQFEPGFLCEDCSDVYSSLRAASAAVTFCCNRPAAIELPAWFLGRPFPGEFQVKPSLVSLFADPKVAAIDVAVAYMDGEGAAVIMLALERGADVRLVMPRHPNVYQSCNSHTLRRLLAAAAHCPGRLTISLHPDMLHAKALVAHKRDGSSVGLVGSCNFKGRSFGQFAELCALFTEPEFTSSLEQAISTLMMEAERVSSACALPRADPTVALVEQWLG